MNLNYVGSLQERFMKFRSKLATTEDLDINIFNAISIYIPKSLATANLAKEYGSQIEAINAKEGKNYLVVTANVSNYREVLAGNLLAQWLPIFNDDTNSSVTLYLVVFDDGTFQLDVSTEVPSWAPLSAAFNDLYFISFFKTMFSEHYDGSKVAEQESGNYDDSNYFDMSLALSQLCETEGSLSFDLAEVHINVPAGEEEDTNACKILTKDRGAEETAAKTFIGSNLESRATSFWGFLNKIGGKHTSLHVHNGEYMIPIILGKWFEELNDSGQFVGNKLAKIRLSGNKVKPTGNPSPLNSAVNLNLDKKYYKNLDDKFVGYFISISDSSLNNAELISDRSISDFPTTAYMISKWIDYNTSRDVANYAAAQGTLTNPVLANEAAYKDIQSFLLSNIQRFSGTRRITRVTLDFPPFSEVKQGNKIVGIGVWKAWYVDDLGGVDISGSITF